MVNHSAEFQVDLILHVTFLFITLSISYFAYKTAKEHKVVVKDASELIEQYVIKILKDIDVKTKGKVDWEGVRQIGKQLENKYYDIENDSYTNERFLQRIVILILGVLALLSVGIIVYHRKSNIDILEIFKHLVIMFVVVGILKTIYFFLVRHYNRPSKLDIAETFVNRIKFHINS